jgi:broad specificity phosphatase PhoE
MIYIVRHGQTELNNRRVLQGRSDHPLNAQGVAQAEAAARRLKAGGVAFDRVFSSPLVRAVQTAQILAPGAAVEKDDRLIEMDYGPYEGMDLSAPAPEVLAFFGDFAHVPAPEGMEPLADVVARTGAFMEMLRTCKGNVLVSTHAIAMKGILEYLAPDSNGGYWSKYIGNCAVYTVACGEDGYTTPIELLKGGDRI